MSTWVEGRTIGHDRAALGTCPRCRHDERLRASVLSRLAFAVGHGRPCAHAVGDEIGPLRNETCGCSHPVHALGWRALAQGKR